ncbi:hypothetical protein TI39_contig312g00025 [Zymoseptoria brevis]|uniref:Uncharacterized protein n=1 Tax=Zymoseptoria brevis TaxID=1047168 RepID=A0A0F4GUN7_9PEZI|nr:hypothetical protein TI39_contig312g00025 [Zymoseptoria brevis]
MKPSDTPLWLASLANAQTYNNFKTDPASLVKNPMRATATSSPRSPTAPKTSSSPSARKSTSKGTVLQVHNAIVDFASYPKWNTFVIDVEARSGSSLTPSPPPVGTKMTFTTVGLLPIKSKSLEEITYINPDVQAGSATRGTYAMSAWKGDMTILAPLEHVNVVTNLGYGYTSEICEL